LFDRSDYPSSLIASRFARPIHWTRDASRDTKRRPPRTGCPRRLPGRQPGTPAVITPCPDLPSSTVRDVSLFGWSAVSPPRPALSQSAGRNGRQGKRAAARSHAQPPLCGEHGEHGEHWTLMAVASGATLDQAGVRPNFRFPPPLQSSGSGSGSSIKIRDRDSINCRDPAHRCARR
jgi:hypothetical protein